MAEKEAHAKMHGEAHALQMEKFYHTVRNLFQGGRLGGAKITGYKRAAA